MKALTLYQPWAQLVALGVKSIETRSWSTSYRGPLAIHAALTTKPWRDLDAPSLMSERGQVQAVIRGLGAMCDETEDSWWSPWIGEDSIWMGDIRLPLGAIVATCTLVDVVPIDPETYDSSTDFVQIRPMGDEGKSFVRVVDHHDPDGLARRHTRYLDEAAYGDFTPGRFAWLLSDVVALPEPIPAKGSQRLWEWDESGLKAAK